VASRAWPSALDSGEASRTLAGRSGGAWRWALGIGGKPCARNPASRSVVGDPTPWRCTLDRYLSRGAICQPIDGADRRRYFQAALVSELAGIHQARRGDRNNKLFRASAALGSLLRSGGMDEELVRSELTAAALACGLDTREAVVTIRSGLRRGMANPRRGLLGDALGTCTKGLCSAPPPSARVAGRGRRPPRPPVAESAALWAACRTVEGTGMPSTERDPDVAAALWLLMCGAHPFGVAALDLARCLPQELPRWLPPARGCSLVVPLFNAEGELAGLWPVAAQASAAGFTVRGLLMADPAGEALLRGEVPPPGWSWDGRVVLATETREYLRWAAAPREGRSVYAVLGTCPSCWSAAVARCVPDGAEVIVRGPRPEPVAGALQGRCRVWW